MSISLCSTLGGNTGRIKCDVKRGNPKLPLIGGAKFTPSEYATSAAFEAAILNRLNRATGDSEKLFPFPLVNTVTNNTEANKTATLGDGTVVTISEGKPAYLFESGGPQSPGVNLETKLRIFNGQSLPIFIFDDNKRVWAKLDVDDNFVGVEAQVYTAGAGFGNYNDPTTTKVNVNYASAADFFDFAAFATTNFDTGNLEGLLDAVLVYVSKVSNAYKFKILVDNVDLINDITLYTEYSDLLASASLWKATVVSTGVTLAITTMAKDATIGGWTVTFDATAFGALAGGAAIKVELVTPALLDAADITGYESVPVIVTK